MSKLEATAAGVVVTEEQEGSAALITGECITRALVMQTVDCSIKKSAAARGGGAQPFTALQTAEMYVKGFAVYAEGLKEQEKTTRVQAMNKVSEFVLSTLPGNPTIKNVVVVHQQQVPTTTCKGVSFSKHHMGPAAAAVVVVNNTAAAQSHPPVVVVAQSHPPVVVVAAAVRAQPVVVVAAKPAAAVVSASRAQPVVVVAAKAAPRAQPVVVVSASRAQPPVVVVAAKAAPRAQPVVVVGAAAAAVVVVPLLQEQITQHETRMCKMLEDALAAAFVERMQMVY